MTRRYCIPLLFALVLCATPAAAQIPVQSSSAPIRIDFPAEGQEFWIVFQKNFRDSTPVDDPPIMKPAEPLSLSLFISSATAARGYVEIVGLDFRKEFAVEAGTVIELPIDIAAQVTSNGMIERKGVHVVADAPVTVSALNHRFQTTDSYLAFPTTVLGTNYRTICYSRLADDLLSQLAVAATEDGTHVTITPSVPVRVEPRQETPSRSNRTSTQQEDRHGTRRPATRRPIEIVLNKGEVYQVIAAWEPGQSCDLTGSAIVSDKPVAVFSGHNCAYVPDPSVKSCNILAEQVPPVETWGTRYVVGTLASRAGSVLRVLAATDSTLVYEDGRLVGTLDAGEYYQNMNLKRHTTITSSNPVLVAQYSRGYADIDSLGDPMMMVLAPVEQYRMAYRFSTPASGPWHHYVNISAPTRSIGGVRFDGAPVDRSRFMPVGDGVYSMAQIEVSYGLHTIDASEPVGVYNYGFGYDEASFDAYGNGGSFGLRRRADR